MIRLNIILAFRNLFNRKWHSLGNIIGLSVGIFSFLSIQLYVRHELSFDQFHEKSEQTYRLWDTFNSNSRQSAMMPYNWTSYLADEFAEIDYATSIQQMFFTVKDGEDVVNEKNVIAADSSFFKVFDFPVLAGNKNKLLTNPAGLILEQATAERYFDDVQNALGKQLLIGIQGRFELFVVDGVVRCPANSHLQFNFIVPFEPVVRDNINAASYESFSTHFIYTYVVMKKPPVGDVLQNKFKDFLFKHGGDELKKRYTTSFQPLHDVYLKSHQEFDFDPRGSYSNVQILSLVGWLVLLISAVNFINISTVQSIKRAKEVGMRKIFGSGKRMLILQFLSESVLISVLSSVLALFMIVVLLPAFNNLSGVPFTIVDVINPINGLIILFIGLSVGILAGLYPAIVISSMGVMQIFKSDNTPEGASTIARKALIVFQFCIATLLLIGTGVIGKQLNYMINKDLGMSSEQVMIINDGGPVANDQNKMIVLKNELSRIEEVKHVTSVSTYPGVPSWSVGFVPEGFDDKGSSMSCIFTDHDFAKSLDIKIVEGRDFDRSIQSDSAGFLINETAQKFFTNYDKAWRTNPIGKHIKSSFLEMDGPVLGIIRDFHFESIHHEIKPLIVMVYPKFKFSTQIRISTQDLPAAISAIEETWSNVNPDIPFNYEFVDDVFAATYISDKRLRNLFSVFSTIAMVLAIIGLLGLSSYMAKDKLREISIRKVLGASSLQLTIKLGGALIILVLIGAFLAMPMAYSFIKIWLAEFPYQIDIPPGLFFGSLGVIVLVCLVTTSYHAIKATGTNPAKILRQN